MLRSFNTLCLLTASILLTALLGGCASTNKSTSSKPTTLELPAHAQPGAALQPLAFMAGNWLGVNPNKTVNHERWTLPRGNHMVGTFHQIRRDGKPAFVEVSLITVEKDGIQLRLRHLHGALEVPSSRTEPNVFRLVNASNNRAEFAGTGDAEEVTSVVYRLVDANTLAVDVGFAPTSRDKPFTSTYTRE
jgi:hypothetical protein